MTGATHDRGPATPPYEKSDVTIKGIVWFTAILSVATAAVMALVAWMFVTFEQRQVRADEAAMPTTRLRGVRPEHPPAPVLQGAPGSNFALQSPLVEMQAWDREMDEQLTTSGWVDRNERTVRIPIDEAKKLLLERGLPVRAGTPRGGTP